MAVRNPLESYIRLAARYGDTIQIPIGPGKSLYLLSRPEHAEHVLAGNQDNYRKAFTYRPLRALIGDGLLTSEGSQWRQHRRIIQPVFSRKHVTGFGPPMSAAAERMLKTWDSLPDGSVINVATEMGALTLDIVGRALFGADLTGDANQMSRAMNAGQKVAVLATLLPLRWGPTTTRMVRSAARRLGHVPEGIEGPVGRLITARREEGQASTARREEGQASTARREESDASEPADVLGVLVSARTPDGAPLTDQEIADEVSTFMLAGHETTANTLSWSLALLSAYPAARTQLEQEVDAVLGHRDPEAADTDKLVFTRAVVSEAMRLYPPAWTIERDAVADDDVAGVPVPAGSLVAISPYLIHRHRDFWPDPAGFDPRRFLPDGSGAPAAAAAQRYAYIPFGGGRRACAGQSFAELETVLVLATIARRYRLELTARGIPVPTANVTLRPGRGLPMRLVRRSRA